MMTSSNFDSTLAARLGADEFGMKSYTMIFLKPGRPENSASKSEAENTALQLAHLKHLFAQKDLGKIVLSGPMGGDAGISGICIYNCPLDEAKQIALQDPRVKAGQLVVEAYPFFGTAALVMVPEIGDKISMKSILEMFQ